HKILKPLLFRVVEEQCSQQITGKRRNVVSSKPRALSRARKTYSKNHRPLGGMGSDACNCRHRSRTIRLDGSCLNLRSTRLNGWLIFLPLPPSATTSATTASNGSCGRRNLLSSQLCFRRTRLAGWWCFFLRRWGCVVRYFFRLRNRRYILIFEVSRL